MPTSYVNLAEMEFSGNEKRRLSSPPREQIQCPLTPSSPVILGNKNSNRRRYSTPEIEKPSKYSDRFIPSRISTSLHDAFDMLDYDEKSKSCSNSLTSVSSSSARESQSLLNNLIRSELVGQSQSNQYKEKGDTSNISKDSPSRKSSGSRNLLKYKSEKNLSFDGDVSTAQNSSTLLSPSSHRRSSPGSIKKSSRKISRQPFKVLDAPQLQDDFYLNLVDWSQNNVLSVGLSTAVYLWSASTAKVTKLHDFEEAVTSVTWSQSGAHLAVGTNSGKVLLWDVAKGQQVQVWCSDDLGVWGSFSRMADPLEMGCHASRVGSLAWSSELLASGSRDKNIYIHDVRVRSFRAHSLSGDTSSVDSDTTASTTSNRSPSLVKKFSSHKQEVCGLKWSPDEKQLATGGNDNKLFVWEMQAADSEPLFQFSDHIAAVKAIAWSPHQHGLLASGGGTADRHIRFWNTVSGTPLHSIDTGSQVCNLMWSRNVNELVSTHGYSLNQVIVWKYPGMNKVATLTGHTFRVLYLAMSPDGESVVTGAGDETLRFWNIFPESGNRRGTWSGGSSLLPSSMNIR